MIFFPVFFLYRFIVQQLDDKGNIIPEALLNHVKKEVLIADWARNSADDFVKKCIDEAAKPDTKAAKPDEMTTCNKQTIMFIHCMFKELNNGCPKDKQKDTEKCKRLREKLNSGTSDFEGPGVDDVEENL